MFCTNCGERIESGATFCAECGTQVEANATAEPDVQLSHRPERKTRKSWLIVPLLGAAVAAGGAFSYFHASRIARERVDAALAEMAEDVGVTYGSVRANPLTGRVTISDVKVVSIQGKPIEGITIDRILARGDTEKSSDPQSLDLVIDHLTFDLPKIGRPGTDWLSMGYQQVVIDSQLDYRYSRKEGKFDLNHFQLAGKDLMTLEASLHLGDIKPEFEDMSQALSDPATTIQGGSFAIRDAIVIDRLLTSLAAKQNTKPEVLRQKLADTAAQLLAGPSSSKVEKDVVAAIVRLIREPGASLQLRMSPTSPVSVKQLKRSRTPAEQAQLLGLEIGS